jgi:predicted HAD superfamily Cof-like phosphohydrolase
MCNIFSDQKKFMKACDQTVGENNPEQFKLHLKLIEEEYNELLVAVNEEDNVEILDALVDILAVTVGAINSMGADGEGAWKEVIRSNFSKIDHATGKVRKREDGKIMKTLSYSPPELQPFLHESLK